MPAYPRHEIVASDEVGVYHCIARCVRRAFLCGFDRLTGRSYEHRKNWIREQLQQLASIFAIEVCGYAVMSNHIHVVLRGRPDLVQIWSDEAVALRWYKLFPRRDSETGKPIEPSESDLNMVVSDQAFHWWTGRAVKFERRAAGQFRGTWLQSSNGCGSTAIVG